MASLWFSNTLAPGEQPDPSRMFERFYTGSAARSSRSSGLGLSIVGVLADQLGGGAEASLAVDQLTVAVQLADLLAGQHHADVTVRHQADGATALVGAVGEHDGAGVGDRAGRCRHHGIGLVEHLIGQLGRICADLQAVLADRRRPRLVEPRRDDDAGSGAGGHQAVDDGLGNVGAGDPHHSRVVVEHLLDELPHHVLDREPGAIGPVDGHVGHRVLLGDVGAGATDPGEDLLTRGLVGADGGGATAVRGHHLPSCRLAFHHWRKLCLGTSSTSR